MSLVGRTLSHYEILEEISRGGMGVVYRARDTRLQRDVALKVLPPELIADPERRARFVQEARAASALEHPHIAVIHGIDEADGISFIAMELVRGEQLSAVLSSGALTPPRALDIAIEIAEGLARAHEMHVVHRDLKPANVMLTDEGHAKIIDFGIAKLIDAAAPAGDMETKLKAETDPGLVLGTVTYMSPEQARGRKVDHRTDIFSFGVVLYEMLAGRPPFSGSTSIDTMHAILHERVPPLPPLGGSLGDDLERILEKCLAKEPEDRYQGMRDVVVDLRAARRRLESGAVAPIAGSTRATPQQRLQRVRAAVYAAAAIVILGLAGYAVVKNRPKSATASAPDAGSKPSVAVLYFENNTGNAQLDWLRTGLTDMLVTDLSQSPDVEVLPTDRLVQILTELKRQDDRTISFDTVQEIAKRAGVKTVILGSYVKAGDTIRINLKLQEPSTGKIVTSERVEAIGESSLFPTVDDLTRRIKARFATPPGSESARGLLSAPGATPAAGGTLDRDLKDVTTSSIDAYRYYAEGVNENDRGRYRQAVPLFEKALQKDPDFALAMVKLAVAYVIVGDSAKRTEYARRAFQHIDRVTVRERGYIEGFYYSTTGEIGKAIDAYTRELELYPDHQPSRNNLAVILMGLERYEDAAQQFEQLIRRGSTFVGAYTNLAVCYDALGRFDDARRTLEDFDRRNPGNQRARMMMGFVLMDSGRLDEAGAAFARARALDPDDIFADLGTAELSLLREQWADADAAARTLRQSKSPLGRLVGAVVSASASMYQGRTTAALQTLDESTRGADSATSDQTTPVREMTADALLQLDRPALALVQAERIVADASANNLSEAAGLLIKARALTRLERGHEGTAMSDLLAARLNALPSDRMRARLRLLDGERALQAHDPAAAIVSFRAAEAGLSPHKRSLQPDIAHVIVVSDLASAYLAAHDDASAAVQFQRIVEGGTNRVWAPIQFVRSLYSLGQINERKGNRAKAAEYYGRFVKYWGDGDVDRDRVVDARAKLAGALTRQ